MTKTGNPATDGKQFVNIPELKSNLLSEYRSFGEGTYTSVNWQYVGRRPIDDINSTYTPAYNVVDLGVRHSRVVGNTVMTWKFQVNNVADVHYWSTIGPGNITGTNVGSYTAHLGRRARWQRPYEEVPDWRRCGGVADGLAVDSPASSGRAAGSAAGWPPGALRTVRPQGARQPVRPPGGRPGGGADRRLLQDPVAATIHFPRRSPPPRA